MEDPMRLVVDTNFVVKECFERGTGSGLYSFAYFDVKI
jgi:hypothetical protein